MASFKKMILVEPSVAERLSESGQREKQIRNYDPTLRNLAMLESEIDSLLKDKSMPDDAKLRIIQTSQHRFEQLASRYSGNVAKHEENEVDPAAGATHATPPAAAAVAPAAAAAVDDNEEEVVDEAHGHEVEDRRRILTAIPLRYRNKANFVLDLIDKSPNVRVDDRLRLVLDGKTIVGSNIIDLMNSLYTPRKKFIAIGSQDFLEALRGLNIPASFVSNRYLSNPSRKRVLAASSKDILPPGNRVRILRVYK